MAYSDLPDLPDLEDNALVPALRKHFIPMEEDVFFRQTLLQNIVNGQQLIGERIAQLTSVTLGTDQDLGSNADDFETWDYDPEI